MATRITTIGPTSELAQTMQAKAGMTNVKVVREVMTTDPMTLSTDDKVADAARMMRDSKIGAVLVNNGSDQLEGLITDRDIVVRAIAADKDPRQTQLSEILSKPTHRLGPDDSVASAVEKMSEANVRRIPVVDGERCVGIVSLGDLAVERNPNSVLGQISSAPANN